MVETFIREDPALPPDSRILPEEWVGTTLFIAATVLAGAQVILRAALDIGLVWGQEFVVTLVIWSVFIGTGAVTARRRHVRMDLVAASLPRRAGALVESFAAAATLAYAAFVLVAAMRFQLFLYDSKEIDPATELPSWCLFVGMPIGIAVTLYRAAGDLRTWTAACRLTV